MRFIILFVSLFAFMATTNATTTHPPKMDKVVIKTSAICGMCKATIEKALYQLEGVEKARLDVVTKKVTVKFDTEQTDVATIRQAISAAGYDADDIPARKKAYEGLPGCCKKGSSCDADAKEKH